MGIDLNQIAALKETKKSMPVTVFRMKESDGFFTTNK